MIVVVMVGFLEPDPHVDSRYGLSAGGRIQDTGSPRSHGTCPPETTSSTPSRKAEALRGRLEPQGLELRVIAPGFVATPMTARNRFPMPFLISAEDAATRIRLALDGKRFLIAFPRPLSLIVRSLRFLPDRLYFALLRRLGALGRPPASSR